MSEMHIRLDDLVIPTSRLREVDADTIPELAESIRLVGQLHPITVRRNPRPAPRKPRGKPRPDHPTWEVVAGARRVMATRWLGQETIRAQEMLEDGEVEDERLRAELTELLENKSRQELTVLERAEHQRRLEVILDELALYRGTGRPTKDAPESALSTVKGRAKATGVSTRVYQHQGQIARIPRKVRDVLRESPLADQKVQLLELARIQDEEKQFAVAKRIAEGHAKKVVEAVFFFDELDDSVSLDEAGEVDLELPPVEVSIWMPETTTGLKWRNGFRFVAERLVLGGALITPLPIGDAFRDAARALRGLPIELRASTVIGTQTFVVWSAQRITIAAEYADLQALGAAVREAVE